MFSSSKCPYCQKSGFEVTTEEPRGSAYKFLFVRCQWCHTVVGVLEHFNIGQLLIRFAQKMNITLP